MSERRKSDLTRIGEAIDFGQALEMIRRLYEAEHGAAFGMAYREYLKSEWWQDLRRRKIRAAAFRCEQCRTNRQKLDVHHLTYERVGREQWEDLIVLCRRCHETEHGI